MVNTKLIMWVMASDYSARTWGHKPNGWPPLVGDLLLFFVCVGLSGFGVAPM